MTGGTAARSRCRARRVPPRGRIYNRLRPPKVHKQDRRRYREYAEQEDQHGVVAGDALVDLQLLIPDLELRVFSQRSEVGEILPAEAEEEAEESKLRKQIQNPFSELAETEAAAAHHHER